MDTSGGGTVDAVLYSVTLAAALVASHLVLGALGRRLRSPHRTSVVIWLLVAIPSLVELGWHSIYDQLSRQPDEICRGQIWRLVTSVAVQDGGVGGTVFNLLSVAVILALAGHLWGSGRTVLLAAVGLLSFNVMTTFASPSAGGGNSGMTFFVATSMVGLAVTSHRSQITVLAAIVTAGVGCALLGLLDAHGEPILAGLLLGVLIARHSPPPPVLKPMPRPRQPSGSTR